MALTKIVVRGARDDNLKCFDVELPPDNLIVITGLSGSGSCDCCSLATSAIGS